MFRYCSAIIGRPANMIHRPKGLMVMHEASFTAGLELNWHENPLYFFPAKIGDDHYLQWITFEGSSKPIKNWDPTKPSYLFIKYQVTDNYLTLISLDPKIAKRAVEDGVVQGIVKEIKGYSGHTITFTESTEGLRRFFATDRGKALFPDDKTKMRLERMK